MFWVGEPKLSAKVEAENTPIGKGVLTIATCLGAFTLHNVNVWLSTASAIVSLCVGLLTVWVLVRKIRKGKE